ncbi:MAG TPA: DUF4255 domain-containing protein [Candidatus Limnocylindrales bacterium]|nr:DUF4255 domain-containing protein [Candidatus Limnocylindrales bacterium]
MSTALAVAGVTAVLRGVLAAWLADQNAATALGGANPEVSAVAPDTIELTGANASPRLNLFLHHVSRNVGWGNVDLPSTSGAGERSASPPLALDLHYLLTAYGPAELQAEVLLGFGMQRLHMVPVLGRSDIEARLPTRLRGSALGRQVELIKITPEPIGTEELSKLWTALQAHYRPSAGYQVSVVLIEAPQAGRAPKPVLSRGPRDAWGRERGVIVAPGLDPGLPVLISIEGGTAPGAAMLGQQVDLVGENLAGTSPTVILESRVLGIRREIPVSAGTPQGVVRFTVPNASVQLAAGVYTVRVRLTPPGAAGPAETNELALSLLPQILTATTPVTPNAQGIARIDLSVRPQVRPFQQAALLIGGRSVPSDPHATPTANLTFRVPAAVADSYLVALRVDGLETPRLDRSATPPAFVGTPVVIA